MVMIIHLYTNDHIFFSATESGQNEAANLPKLLADGRSRPLDLRIS